MVKNAFTGLGVLGFAVGVCKSCHNLACSDEALMERSDVFTIKAVAQDDFEDVPIPDGPAPAAGAPHTSVNSSAGKAAQ